MGIRTLDENGAPIRRSAGVSADSKEGPFVRFWARAANNIIVAVRTMPVARAALHLVGIGLALMYIDSCLRVRASLGTPVVSFA